MSIDKNRHNIALIIPRLEQGFLTAEGVPVSLEKDAMAALFQATQEAFVNLHSQRAIDVLDQMFQAMPKGETLDFIIDTDYDDPQFYICLSNGWQLGMEVDDPTLSKSKDPSDHAPAWFPRDPKEVARWDAWFAFFVYKGAFTSDIESIATNKIVAFQEVNGPLQHHFLPTLRGYLMDPEWLTALEAQELEKSQTASPTARKRSPRL